MDPDTRTDRGVPAESARRSIDLQLAIEATAGRQKHLIRLEQLVASGLSPSGVSKRVARRRLHRMHRTVFATHGPPYDTHQRYLAAVMACGPGSTISDTAAAWLLGHREVAPYLPHVSNATGRGRTLDGVKVHQREIEPRDLFHRFDIPCTAPARTILDCAARVGVEQLEELLMAADSGRPRLDRNRMEQLVAANPGARGIANLRELITDDPKESRSENERRMLRICRRFEIRDPETEYEIRAEGKTFYADFCWPELGSDRRVRLVALAWRQAQGGARPRA